MAPASGSTSAFAALIEFDADLASTVAGFVQSEIGWRCRVLRSMAEARHLLLSPECRALLVDAEALGGDGGRALTQLRSERPGLGVVITARDWPGPLVELVGQIGGRLLGKPYPVDRLRVFFEEVRVATAVDRCIAEVVARCARECGASGQERRVLELALEHASQSEISDELVIEVGTVKGYTRSLLCKTGDSSLRALARRLALEARIAATLEHTPRCERAGAARTGNGVERESSRAETSCRAGSG